MTRLLLALLMAVPLVVCAQQTPPCAPLVNDLNGDFIVGATDILQLLSAFGENYDMDGDLIPDCVDPCMGVVDECGVCNGSGPQVPVIQSINILLDSTYIADTDSWTVFEAGADTVYAMLCEEPAEFNDCGDPVFMDGYNHETVLIGDQCWFAENLRTRVYTNGDAITSGLTNEEWTSTAAGAAAVYGEGEGGCLDAGLVFDAPCYLESLAQYGRLYNWHAVDDARGVCPTGWHVPTDDEWVELSDYVASQGFDGTEGAALSVALKSTTGWSDGGNGTDDFGFSALPGGIRDEDTGSFWYAGTRGFWWSSSFSGYYAYFWGMSIYGPTLYRDVSGFRAGRSVRCLMGGILGCTDPDYLEYDAAATEDDGSCATLVVEGCTDPDYLEYDAAANFDDGSCATLFNPCEVEMDGYTYQTVLIGDQCWFAENLRTTVYANGDAITSGLTNEEWGSTLAGASAVYGQVEGSCIGTGLDIDASCLESLSQYGRLYNWYAVDDARGLCPTGWHVPTDDEWTELEDYIIDEMIYVLEGTALKSTSGWSDGGNGTDDLGFSALPGGLRFSSGLFSGAGGSGDWWSSSPDGSLAWFRSLVDYSSSIYRYSYAPRFGFSVRCLQDAE